MTPKEKAKSLYNKMLSQQHGPGIEASYGNAKRSAMIAVEEIIMSNPTKEVGLTFFNDPDTVVKPDIEYWQQVKTEIDKL